MENKFSLYTDGGARGNPGPGACGIVIKKDDKVILKKSKHLGHSTNNQAEYNGLIFGLEEASELKIKELDCLLDSELVVKQMKGEYRVKDSDLIPLYKKVVNLSEKFDKITFRHIRRAENALADSLVNEELDKKI